MKKIWKEWVHKLGQERYEKMICLQMRYQALRSTKSKENTPYKNCLENLARYAFSVFLAKTRISIIDNC